MRLLLAALLTLSALPALAQTLTVPTEPMIRGAIDGYLRHRQRLRQRR